MVVTVGGGVDGAVEGGGGCVAVAAAVVAAVAVVTVVAERLEDVLLEGVGPAEVNYIASVAKIER